jgi:hypothetical protein
MTKADQLFERGASFLEGLSRKAASEGGFLAKVAEPLAEDADFLRTLKPTLVMARLRGEAPTDGKVDTGVENPATVEAQLPPPPPPVPEPKNKRKKKKSGGPNPIVIAAAAFAVGVLVAKMIDWRGHAHPRF